MVEKRTSKELDRFTSPAGALLSQEEWRSVAKVLGLTARQSQIAERILQAKKDKQIASELGVGISTIRMHIRHMYARLNVHDRMELVLRIFAITRSPR